MSRLKAARLRYVVPWGMALAAASLGGCGGGGAAPDLGFPASLPNYNPPAKWVALIENAGFLPQYAELARDLISRRKVKVVSPPDLDPDINAYAWIPRSEIWINSPMYERYPDVVHQATIFLHELIHIESGEMTHGGPWWSNQDLFAMHYQNEPRLDLAHRSNVAER